MPKNSYLLTEEGLKKIYAAFVKICRKPSPSKEEMGLCVGLNSDTIRKLMRRTGGVNRDTLELGILVFVDQQNFITGILNLKI